MNKSGLKKSRKYFILLICLGLVLVAAGSVFEYVLEDNKTGGRLINFGAGFFVSIIAVASVNLIIMKRNPDAEKEHEINEKDERHIKIREKSAYSVFYVTMFSLLAAIITFVFLGSWTGFFITFGVMMVHCISFLLFLHRYNKMI